MDVGVYMSDQKVMTQSSSGSAVRKDRSGFLYTFALSVITHGESFPLADSCRCGGIM